MEYELIVHEIPPVYDCHSRILILGSLPSRKSREQGFFYGHPQNRFWPVLSAVLKEKTPVTIQDKKEMLLRNHIALWDVIAPCEIKGSSDSSIRNAVPNNLQSLIQRTEVERVFTVGSTATKLYEKYCERDTGIPAIMLPSTSGANARFSTEILIKAFSAILL